MDDLDEFFELMFWLFTPWRILAVCIVAFIVLSVTGVIPWSAWL